MGTDCSPSASDRALGMVAGMRRRQSSALLSCLAGVFHSLFPCVLFKSSLQHQPCPCCTALPAPGATLPSALDQLLPERGFLASPEWDGSRDCGMDGWTLWLWCDGVCLYCKAARDVSGCGIGGFSHPFAKYLVLSMGLNLHSCTFPLLPAEPCPHSMPHFTLPQRQLLPRSTGPGVLGLFSVCPSIQARLRVLCWILQPRHLHPAAGGDGAVLLSLYLSLLVPTMGKSQALGWE